MQRSKEKFETIINEKKGKILIRMWWFRSNTCANEHSLMRYRYGHATKNKTFNMELLALKQRPDTGK